MNTEILVIEDDDLVRQGIVDILELKGWNAVAAKSCSEALVRIRGEEYMLYVLDMEAARRERNHALQGDPQIYRQSHSFLISL